MPGLSCRFYQHRFPEVEDVVMVNVRSIAEMGAYVSLLEYNNIEGMILLSELSRRRIRSINKLIRIGRNECVVVIRVDKEKGGLFNLITEHEKQTFLHHHPSVQSYRSSPADLLVPLAFLFLCKVITPDVQRFR